MSKVKFKLNYRGVRQLLHSDEMVQVLEANARRVSDNAGEGYEIKHMGTRVIAVETSSREAVQDNLEHNTLLKAVR